MFLFEACLVYISWIMQSQMRILMHRFWNHSDRHSLKQNICVSSVTSRKLETFMLLGPNCAYHMMYTPNTQVYCTFKFTCLLFVEVTNHFIQWQYHNIIKKWPFKKTKSYPNYSTSTLGSLAKHPCNTMADIILYKRNKVKGFTNSDKKMSSKEYTLQVWSHTFCVILRQTL